MGSSIWPAWHTTPMGPATCEAVLRLAPSAARHAAAVGAHRQAAAQYARALRYASDLAPAARAEILERQAHESFLADEFDVVDRRPAERPSNSSDASGDQIARGRRAAATLVPPAVRRVSRRTRPKPRAGER